MLCSPLRTSAWSSTIITLMRAAAAASPCVVPPRSPRPADHVAVTTVPRPISLSIAQARAHRLGAFAHDPQAELLGPHAAGSNPRPSSPTTSSTASIRAGQRRPRHCRPRRGAPRCSWPPGRCGRGRSSRRRAAARGSATVSSMAMRVRAWVACTTCSSRSPSDACARAPGRISRSSVRISARAPRVSRCTSRRLVARLRRGRLRRVQQRLGLEAGREQRLRHGVVQLTRQAGALGGHGAALHLLAQPRVLDGERRLVAKRRRETEVVVAERPRSRRSRGRSRRTTSSRTTRGTARQARSLRPTGAARGGAVATARRGRGEYRTRPPADGRDGLAERAVAGRQRASCTAPVAGRQRLQAQALVAGLEPEQPAAVAAEELPRLHDDVEQQLRQRPVRVEHRHLLQALQLRRQ